MSDTPRVDRELSRLGRIFDNGSIRYRQAEAASMRSFARQFERELAEARAEIGVLKAALWYFGNSLGPDVAEEIENALPKNLSQKINLREVEDTNGEVALSAAERGEEI